MTSLELTIAQVMSRFAYALRTLIEMGALEDPNSGEHVRQYLEGKVHKTDREIVLGLAAERFPCAELCLIARSFETPRAAEVLHDVVARRFVAATTLKERSDLTLVAREVTRLFPSLGVKHERVFGPTRQVA